MLMLLLKKLLGITNTTKPTRKKRVYITPELEKLICEMNDKGYKQKDIAETLNISASNVSKVLKRIYQ